MAEQDYPKRRRWGGDREELAYPIEDGVDDGTPATIEYESFDGDHCAVDVEIGTFESHNSWLSSFDSKENGDMYMVRPDGVVLYHPFEELDEIGECIRVTAGHRLNPSAGSEQQQNGMEHSED